MISWIQQRLIRHGRWIFLLLLAVIIVAFVFTIGNTPGCTSNNTAYEPNNFYGYDLNSPIEMEPMSERVTLSNILSTGRPVQNQQQFQSLAMARIATLYLADQIGVPAPDAETLASYIRTKRAFSGPDGQFSADAYTSFIDNMESNPRIQSGTVIAVLKEDYRLEQVASALRGPGYVLPAEALAKIKNDQTTFTLSTASIAYATFELETTAEESALKAFYEANKLQYEIPERIEASYVLFPAEQYTALVGELDEQALREHFITNRAQFVAEFEATRSTKESPSTEEAETPEEPVTFENVRESVATSLSAEKALRLANEAAQAFAYTLYNDEITRDSAAFNTLLSTSNLSLKKIEPYTAQGAGARALSSEMLTSAFDLGDDRYYSDAYELDNGFGVLIYEGRIAPEIPAYDDIVTQIESAYLAEEKRRLFNEEGDRLKAELDAKIAADANFIEAAEALGLTANAYETFKGSEAPQDLNPAAITQAQQLEAGTLSPMVQSGGEGLFVYLTEKSVPEITEDNEDVTKTLSYLKNYSAYLTQNSLINELISGGLPDEQE